MKTTCPFCKTEYSAHDCVGRNVECVCCGHIWKVKADKKSGLLLVFAAAIALLAAVIFTIVVLVSHNGKSSNDYPLAAIAERVQIIADSDGVEHYVVTGRIENKSESIQGVPDIIIVAQGRHGKILASQRFMAPAPVLGVKESAEFSHMLEQPVSGAKKVSIEFYTENE